MVPTPRADGEDAEGRRLAEVLAEFAHTMVTEFPIQAILDRLVERIVDVLAVSSAGVTLISPGGANPFYVAASDPDALRFESLQSELGEGPCVEACRTGRAVAITDVYSDDRFALFSPRARQAGLGAVFAFPLLHDADPLGALDLYSNDVIALSPASMSAAQTLADVAAAYILNARVRDDLRRAANDAHDLLCCDDLTGLANRRGTLDELGRLVRRARRPGHTAAVLFADLDHFKHVNDVHGHQVGDELLVAVAKRLSATVRPGDTVGRLSGDEFVILCDDLHDTADADHLAHRVAAAVAAPFALSAGVVNTTISVGIVFTANGDQDPGELLHAADIAMYRAKQRTGADPDVVVIDETVPCPDSTEAELRRDLSG